MLACITKSTYSLESPNIGYNVWGKNYLGCLKCLLFLFSVLGKTKSISAQLNVLHDNLTLSEHKTAQQRNSEIFCWDNSFVSI